MRHRSQIVRLSLWIAVIALFFPQAAYAYIDLGTGSYMLQMALAGALGAFFVLKVYFKRIFAFLRGLFAGRKKEDTPADPK